MKKLSLLIILATSASLMLSSCSRIKDISITKRHYRSGFYVDLGGPAKRSITTPRVSATVEAATTQSSLILAENKNVVPAEKVSQSSNPVASAIPVKKKKQIHKHTISNAYASTQDISVLRQYVKGEALSKYVTSMPNDFYSNSPKSSSTAPMWVIILFAILIPPVGVALKFGIVDKFWISLLLTLLFWLPGAIYSVIVVTQR